jgi:histone deacetylase 1/2
LKTFQSSYTSHQTTISPLPPNPIDALNDHNWKLAMNDEYNALIENKTWELVPRPSNANVIRSMWIFRHKKNSYGSFERYKARLLGNGANQQEGVDCGETSAMWSSQLLYARFLVLLYLSHGVSIN